MDADVTDPAVLRLASPVSLSDGPRLCAELTRLAAAGATEIVCDVSALHTPQLAAVEALSRLRLTARRTGCHLRLRHPTPDRKSVV